MASPASAKAAHGGLVTSPPVVSFTGILLYLLSPFFAHPPKLLLSPLIGCNYVTAYAHFRRDHRKSFNLFFHWVILFFQITFNFAFLRQLDVSYPLPPSFLLAKTFVKLPVIPTLCGVTAGLWAVILSTLTTTAPVVVRLGALAVLFLGWCTKDFMAGTAVDTLIHLQPIVDSFVYLFILNKSITIASYALALGIRYTIHYLLYTYCLGMFVVEDATIAAFLNLNLIALACVLSYKPFTKPLKGVFGLMILCGAPLAILVRHPIYFWWSSGFIITAMQGVSHRETAEPPTMPHLQNVSFEVSHVAFFPVLLGHAIYDQLVEGGEGGRGGSASNKKKK